MKLFKDEKGTTSVGMAVALLVCLALIFSSAQVYRLSSSSAEIQEVADAATLAAENEVAEFMIAVNVCDAAILSMTLLAATIIGLGVVTACIPPLFGLSEQLVSFGSKIVKAKNKFAELSAHGLNELQKLLPFISVISAFSVAQSNNNGAMQANYLSLAVLVPNEGKEISVDDGMKLDALDIAAQDKAEEIRENSEKAEEAAKKLADAKERAFMADCGNAPERCQYERAKKLSNISSAKNPIYESPDTWSFNVALERAKSYYAARVLESPPTTSISDKASYYLRMRYYKYVSSQLESGYVKDAGDTIDMYFPAIFKNTKEFKTTTLYSEKAYAISASASTDGKQEMHAYAGCPAISFINGYGSISQMDTGQYAGCQTCGFEVESMGNIASASTNVSTGFEYHYEIIREAAKDYMSAAEELKPFNDAAKDDVESIWELFKELLNTIGAKRISASPPGSNGCITMVVNLANNKADTGFESLFVDDSKSLGPRAAVSGATLIEDTSHDNSSLITSLLDGFGEGGGTVVGGARIVLDAWSGMLKAYENGQTALFDTLENGLNSFSVITISGLGSWASKTLKDVVKEAGLEPARLNAQKAVIINTSYIASSDTGPFSVNYKKIQDAALWASSGSTNLFTGIINAASKDVIDRVDKLEITVAEIEFPVGGLKFPITITLPDSFKDTANDAIGSARDALTDLVAKAAGTKEWH